MKKLLLTLTLGATVTTGMAVTPLWMRDVRISPDGTEILFCYKGDIYKVAASGGEAVQLTTQESYEPLRCGVRTASRLLSQATVTETWMYLSCRPKAVLHAD